MRFDAMASQAWLAFRFSPDTVIAMQHPDPTLRKPADISSSLELRVSGRVQGVGFRYFTHEVARRLGLVGYVMNLKDGAVRIYAEGPREPLEEFLKVLQKGAGGAQVREVRSVWGAATGQHSTFTIQPTF
jgi:acylphosphatase